MQNIARHEVTAVLRRFRGWGEPWCGGLRAVRIRADFVGQRGMTRAKWRVILMEPRMTVAA